MAPCLFITVPVPGAIVIVFAPVERMVHLKPDGNPLLTLSVTLACTYNVPLLSLDAKAREEETIILLTPTGPALNCAKLIGSVEFTAVLTAALVLFHEDPFH